MSLLWQGWLNKCGEKVKNWKRRWCRLFATGELVYYKHEEDASVAGKEKGSLMFRQLSESELCGGTTHPSAYATCYLGGPSLIFVVMTPSRAWMFSFVDVQDRGKLIPKIQTLIDSCRLGASASSASKNKRRSANKGDGNSFETKVLVSETMCALRFPRKRATTRKSLLFATNVVRRSPRV